MNRLAFSMRDHELVLRQCDSSPNPWASDTTLNVTPGTDSTRRIQQKCPPGPFCARVAARVIPGSLCMILVKLLTAGSHAGRGRAPCHCHANGSLLPRHGRDILETDGQMRLVFCYSSHGVLLYHPPFVMERRRDASMLFCCQVTVCFGG